MRNLNKRFPCFGGQILQHISSKADLYWVFFVVVLLMTAELSLPVKIKCCLSPTFGLNLNACGGRFGASLWSISARMKRWTHSSYGVREKSSPLCMWVNKSKKWNKEIQKSAKYYISLKLSFRNWICSCYCWRQRSKWNCFEMKSFYTKDQTQTYWRISLRILTH